MRTSHQRGASLIILSVVLTLLLIALPHSVGAETPRAASPSFGPALYLLRPTAAQVPLLPRLPVVIHAEILQKTTPGYIASGDAAAETAIAAAGIALHVLDADTTGKVYYFLDASAPQARQLAGAFGTIAYADDRQLLLAAAQAREAGLVAALPTGGVSIALLSPDRLALAAPGQLRTAALTPADALPAVAALLPRVSEARLNELVADLSGARPAVIGGAPATITTRYTFAADMTRAEAYVRQHYTALGLAPVTLPWSYASYSGRNIVADIRGLAHPERIWLVGGHLDSISEAPYSSAPGADDNATGSAATLLLAEVLAGQRFADTIRFVHFTGEEQGMWGSKAYVRDLQAAGAQVMGYVDLDMIGWDGDGDRTVELHSGTASASISLANAFISANGRYGQGLRVELKQNTASRFSDHSSFWDTGYGAFLTIENFYDDAIPRDRNPWYHSSGDTLARVDLNYVARSARTALATMAELADIVTGPLPTATATATATRTPTATATLAPGVCQELLVNGGFEMSAGWTFPGTAYPAAFTTARARTGSRSLRAGVDTTPDRYAYSDAYQTVAIPASAATVTLRAWWLPRSAEGNLAASVEGIGGMEGTEGTGGTEGTDEAPSAALIQALADGNLPQGLLAGDRQYLLLLNASGTILAVPLWTRSDAAAWSPLTFDLTAYRGQTIQIRFGVYNDGNGQSSVLYLDDAALAACPPNVATATPTATPTASRTATVSPTRTATATPTASRTSTASPTATVSPTRTATASATRSPTATPTPTRTASPTASRTPTITLTATATRTATPTATRTATASVTTAPTVTRTSSPTATRTPTKAATATRTRTPTATMTLTATQTRTATRTATPTTTRTSTRTPAATATATRIPTATPTVCAELLANGGFETNTGWVMPNTVYPAAFTTAFARTGSRSLRAGVDVPPDRYSYSDAYQLVAIPANAASVTLRAWWLSRSAEGNLVASVEGIGGTGGTEGPDEVPAVALIQALADGNLPQGLLAGDRQYLLLLNASGTILAVPLWTRSDAATWAPLTFDLTPYRGQTIQVRFGVYNDGNGQSTALYLDDATTAACPSPAGQARRDEFRVWMPLVWSGRP